MKKRKKHLLHFGLASGSEREKTDFRERESPTSLYISLYSDRRLSSEQEEKLVYAARATCGHRFCGVLTSPRGRGFLLLVLFLG